MIPPAFLSAVPLSTKQVSPSLPIPLPLPLSSKTSPVLSSLPLQLPPPSHSVPKSHLLTAIVPKIAATAVTIALTLLPLSSLSPPAIAHSAHNSPTFVAITAANRISSSIAVIGVAKAPIHDYSIPIAAHDYAADARRELSLATRLITAVLLGAILGVERSATQLNLGVRSITLISVTSAVVTITLASLELSPTLFATYPALAVVAPALLAGLAVYAAAKLRQPRPRNAAAMSSIVALSVAMGAAAAAGLSIITLLSCLAAVYIMRRSYTPTPRRKRTSNQMSTANNTPHLRKERLSESERYVEVRRSPPYDSYPKVKTPDAPDGQAPPL